MSTGGVFPLQEADQEEQGAAVGHDGSGQEQGPQGPEQRQEGQTGGLPAPLLSATGELMETNIFFSRCYRYRVDYFICPLVCGLC